jgi:hypothetical protein
LSRALPIYTAKISQVFRFENTRWRETGDVSLAIEATVKFYRHPDLQQIEDARRNTLHTEESGKYQG